MKKMIFFALFLFLFCESAYAWEVKSRWVWPQRNGKNRVQVLCKDGRMPTLVEETPTKWCLVRKSGTDYGFCRKSMEEAARAWCKE